MGVQVVQHHSDPLRLGVSSMPQPAHLMGDPAQLVRRSVTATCLQPASVLTGHEEAAQSRCAGTRNQTTPAGPPWPG